MTTVRRMSQDEAAFRRMKPEIDGRFPRGHWVAFDNGLLIADAPSHEDLSRELAAIGKDNPNIFVAQAGLDYPKFVWMLIGA